MGELQREILGSIWRLCEQMSYTAQEGHVETLKVQYLALSKYIERLNMIEKFKGA